MKTTIRWAGVALVAFAAQLAMVAGAARPDARAEAGPTAPESDATESDMSHTGTTPQGTVTVPWNLLGGAVGNRTVNGVRVELYVLQAQDPGIKSGDPNHVFTVTLKDDQSGEFLKQGEVSIAVTGGTRQAQRSEMAARSSGVFRSGVSLPQPGDYRLTIAFKTAGRSGQADFPYVFRPFAEAVQAHHHDSGERLHPQAVATAGAATRTERSYFTPDVTLMDMDGRTVALRPLLETDQPMMLTFIYTSCTAICPLLSETFAQVQRELGADGAKLRMVSITIDPEYDTPKVLRTYAQTYRAGAQWRFLTGNPKDISEVRRAFEAYRVNKMDHASVVFLRASQGKPWIRFDGLVSPATLVREYRAMRS
jgi:protein SCO1/2